MAIICIASTGYVIIEPEYSFLDALYMSVITISTAGHLEVRPLSDPGRVWTIIVLISGVATGAVVLSLLGAMVVEGQIRRVLGRRQLEQKIKGLSGHVIICGYGRMGEMIATDLEAAGRRTVIVDDDPERTSLAGAGDLLYVLGDAQDEEVLTSAGIARATELVCALPTDAENVMATLTARQANTEIRILTLARQRAAERKLLQAGATRVICPHVMGASRIVNLVVRPAVVDFFEVAGKGVDFEVDQIVLSSKSELVGKSLRELELPHRAEVHVAAIRKGDGQMIYRPGSGVTLEAGDTVIVFGKSGVAAALEELHL
jgi:voltage-gated potassium channel